MSTETALTSIDIQTLLKALRVREQQLVARVESSRASEADLLNYPNLYARACELSNLIRDIETGRLF